MGFIKSCRKVSRLRGCHLIHFNNCFCSQKVRLCLEYKGIRWTNHHVNLLASENIRPSFFQINPYGRVPVLVHDGVTIIESTDIMIYLENTFPDRPLKPQDQARFTEMKELLSLADSIQEAIFCLALHFYFGERGKKSASDLNRCSQLCCSKRSLYELHVLHKDGFSTKQLRAYMENLHSCFALLDFKLSQLRANLVGAELSLADFSWAPIVYQASLMAFPMSQYPHVLMWFDIIENSATFYRAVTAWGGSWMLQTELKLRVGTHEILGCGIEGVENNYQPVFWMLPIVCLLVVGLCFLLFPCHGIHLHHGLSIPRALVLYVMCGLLVASVVFAYTQSHQPRSTASLQANNQPQQNGNPRDAMMTALVAADYGGPEVLRLDRAHIRPVIKTSTEVLVKVSAASLSPSDVKISSGQGHHYFNFYRRCKLGKAFTTCSEFPIVLGRDFCGTVVEMGSQVSGLDIGQEVWGCVPAWYSGCLAEYVVIDTAWLSWKPSSITEKEAAAVPYAGCTALQILELLAGRKKTEDLDLTGKRLLVHGASGGVGCILVQIAKSTGAHVTVSCSEEATPMLTQRLGADKAINYQTHNCATVLQDEKFDMVVQLVNVSGLTASSLELTAPGGSMVTLVHDLESRTSDHGVLVGYMLWLVGWLKVHIPQRVWYNSSLVYMDFSPKGTKRRLDHLAKLIEEGKVRPVVQRCVRLEEYHLAFKQVTSGHAHGKYVISMQH